MFPAAAGYFSRNICLTGAGSLTVMSPAGMPLTRVIASWISFTLMRWPTFTHSGTEDAVAGSRPRQPQYADIAPGGLRQMGRQVRVGGRGWRDFPAPRAMLKS